MRCPLTVLIPCKNERRNIRPCIESAQTIADEILVADSGSTDGTLNIVRDIGGCRIIEREYVNSGNFKNWAIPQARHEWVLLVDADERVTPPLAAEIRDLLASVPSRDGYRIRRENYFMGHRIRYGAWGADDVLRLFHRDRSRFVGEFDHADIDLPPARIGRLRGRLQHFTYWSYDQYFAKLHRYATYQAQIWHLAGRRPSFWKLLLRAPLRFLHTYIIRGGFLDGLPGLQVCGLISLMSFMKQARLWELSEGLPQPDPEAERAERREQIRRGLTRSGGIRRPAKSN